jgi:tagatose 1,6-diphosphate aldolase
MQLPDYLNPFTKNGFLPMLAFDHRASFKKMLEKEYGREVSDAEVIALKQKIMAPLLEHASGVLIDQDYGLPAYKALSSTLPFLLPMEKSGYVDTLGERTTELMYGAESLLNDGAQGAKLLLYSNKNLPSWKMQLETAKRALDDAKAHTLPFFLELVLYEAHDTKPGTIAETLAEAIKEGVIPDVWKIPYPGSKELCDEVQRIVGDTPWILLTGGSSYEEFAKQYEEAVASGARGFLAGRALWQDAVTLCADEAACDAFIEQTLVDRFLQLLSISKHS